MAANPNCAGLDDYLGSSASQVAANRNIGKWITEQMRTAARSEGLLLIDCAAEVACSHETLGDAIHLTQAGHRAVAEQWARALRPLIQDSRGEAQVQPSDSMNVDPGTGGEGQVGDDRAHQDSGRMEFSH
jgi:hypothetical protein